MFLSDLGIEGWENIEPALVAAIAANKSILFIGNHGTNKTEGSERIAKAILGKDAKFNKYDTPLIQMEDLIGFPNPAKLSTGELDYIQTNLSVWKADAILLDELNRANIFMQGKLLELINKKEIMGKKTDIKLIFSAINPPEKYNSGYMDLALASRFCCFNIEDIVKKVNKETIEDILSGETDAIEIKNDLKNVINSVKDFKFKPSIKASVSLALTELKIYLEDNGITWSVRQMKFAYQILEKLVALYIKDIYSITMDDVSLAIIGMIPEVNRITNKEVSSSLYNNIALKIDGYFKFILNKDLFATSGEVAEKSLIDELNELTVESYSVDSLDITNNLVIKIEGIKKEDECSLIFNTLRNSDNKIKKVSEELYNILLNITYCKMFSFKSNFIAF